MSIQSRTNSKSTRFASLFAKRKSDCSQSVFDTILWENEDVVVVPTLGSIVSNWMLIIPKDHYLNFHEWSEQKLISIDSVLREVVEGLCINDSDWISFEHGPKVAGTNIGCGVDYAHLHLLANAPFSFEDMVLETKKRTHWLSWRQADLKEMHNHLLNDSSYLMLTDHRSSFVASEVEGIGSQFMRRVISTLVDLPDHWDYRAFPETANAMETRRRFA